MIDDLSDAVTQDGGHKCKRCGRALTNVQVNLYLEARCFGDSQLSLPLQRIRLSACKTRIASCLEVPDRLLDYILQRHSPLQPQQVLCLSCHEIGDFYRRVGFSTRHIRYSEFCCRINLFEQKRVNSRNESGEERRLTDVLVEEVTRANDDTLTSSGRSMCRAYIRIRSD
jgi:hypothetical protein